MVYSGLLSISIIYRRLYPFSFRGVLLLPYGRLPLNIFEPRYLAMTDDALATDRLIRNNTAGGLKAQENQNSVFKTGCAGE